MLDTMKKKMSLNLKKLFYKMPKKMIALTWTMEKKLLGRIINKMKNKLLFSLMYNVLSLLSLTNLNVDFINIF